jgi:hypothetical protein
MIVDYDNDIIYFMDTSCAKSYVQYHIVNAFLLTISRLDIEYDAYDNYLPCKEED